MSSLFGEIVTEPLRAGGPVIPQPVSGGVAVNREAPGPLIGPSPALPEHPDPIGDCEHRLACLIAEYRRALSGESSEAQRGWSRRVIATSIRELERIRVEYLQIP